MYMSIIINENVGTIYYKRNKLRNWLQQFITRHKHSISYFAGVGMIRNKMDKT